MCLGSQNPLHVVQQGVLPCHPPEPAECSEFWQFEEWVVAAFLTLVAGGDDVPEGQSDHVVRDAETSCWNLLLLVLEATASGHEHLINLLLAGTVAKQHALVAGFLYANFEHLPAQRDAKHGPRRQQQLGVVDRLPHQDAHHRVVTVLEPAEAAAAVRVGCFFAAAGWGVVADCISPHSVRALYGHATLGGQEADSVCVFAHHQVGHFPCMCNSHDAVRWSKLHVSFITPYRSRIYHDTIRLFGQTRSLECYALYMNEAILKVAAKAVIVNDKGEVLILREGTTYSDGTQIGKYGLPGGRLDAGERFEDGLLREAKEETGLTVKPLFPLYVGEWHPVIKGVPHQIIAVFMACRADGEDVVLSDEHDEYKWIKPEDRTSYTFMDPDGDVLDQYAKMAKEIFHSDLQ